MAVYTFVAHDTRTSQKVNSEVEAESEQAAAKQLMSRGLSPLEIKEKKVKGGPLKNHIGTKNKVIFSRQLSTLINAGLPLIQSLSTVKTQTKNPALQLVLVKIIKDVEAGAKLSDAMAKHPRVFNNVYISLVAAGEESGTLAKSLDRIALQQEKDAEIMSKIKGAMIYPLIVVVVLFAIMVFMTTTVLPQVQGLYAGIPGAKLPFVTVLMLIFSHAVLKFWYFFIVAGIIALMALRNWFRTPGGRSVLDNVKMHAWPAGPLFMKLYMARFARTSSTLATSGVPMLDMLTVTSEAVGNVHITHSLQKAISEVKGGKPLSDSLRGNPYFLDLVPDMIHIGEQSGELDTMLAKVADYYEKEVEDQVKSISTIVEPVMMLVVGIVALVIVAAVLLPIYSLAGKNLGG